MVDVLLEGLKRRTFFIISAHREGEALRSVVPVRLIFVLDVTSVVSSYTISI